ncbi:MAG: hypothetical protein QM784_01280 [Polyangiaceae bacterium]
MASARIGSHGSFNGRALTWSRCGCCAGALLLLGCAGANPVAKNETARPAPKQSQPQRMAMVEEKAEPLGFVIAIDDPERAWSRVAALYGRGPLSSALGAKLADYISLILGSPTVGLMDGHAQVRIGFAGLAENSDPDMAVSFGVLPGSSRELLNLAFRIVDDDAAEPEAGDPRPICSYRETKASAPRLVCANTLRVLRRLESEFRTEGHSSGADLRFEIKSPVMHQAAEEERSKPAAESAGENAGRLVALETMDNLESVGCNVTFDAEAARVSVDVTMKSTIGVYWSLLLGPTALAHPPRFERIPSDAFVALTFSGVPGDVLRASLAPISRSLNQDLAKEFPQSMVEAVTTEMRKIFLTGGPLRYMAGTSKQAAMPARRGAKGGSSADTSESTSPGWWAIVLDEPIDKWTNGVRNLIALDQRDFALAPGEELKTPTANSDTTEVKEIRKKGAAPSRNLVHLTIRRAANPNYRGSAKEKLAREQLIHVVITGNEATTYIVGAGTEPLALSRAKELSDKKGPTSAEQNWYLEPQSDKHTRALGFVTPRGFMTPFLIDGSAEESESARRILETLTNLPKNGNAPIAFEYYSDATSTPLTGHFDFRLDAELLHALLDLAGNSLFQ